MLAYAPVLRQAWDHSISEKSRSIEEQSSLGRDFFISRQNVLNLFIIACAVSFWLIVIGAVIKVARKKEAPMNEKIQTAEQVNAVLKNVHTGEEIRIQ